MVISEEESCTPEHIETEENCVQQQENETKLYNQLGSERRLKELG